MKFLSILLIFMHFSANAMDCSTLWREGFPARGDRHLAYHCEKFIPESTVLPGQLSVYVTNDYVADPLVKAKLNLVSEALLKAYNYYRALGEMPEISLVQTNSSYFGDTSEDISPAMTFISFYQSGETCPILLYNSALTLSNNHLQQLVAHEVFHCFQQENYKSQSQNSVQHDLGKWWFEGIAQFMSNLVYPSFDFEYSPIFPALDHNMSVTMQASSYRAAHFFQSYYNNKGADIASLFSVMASAPTAPYGDEMKVFEDMPGAQNLFHLYGQNIADKKLYDSSGAAARLPELEKTEHILTTAREQEIRLSYMAQTLHLHRVTFPKASRIRLFIQTPIASKTSVQKTGQTEWTEMPSEFETTCDDEKQLDFLITSSLANMDGLAARLKVTREEKMDCACDYTKRPTDSCLYGRWQVDHATVLAMLNRTIRIPGAQAISSEGDFIVDMNEDGVMKWNLGNWRSEVKAPLAGGMMMNMVQTMNGMTTSQYSNGSGRICSLNSGSTVRITRRITVGGNTSTTHENLSEAAPGNFTYTCNDNMLIYHAPVDGPAAGTQFDYVFYRL